jgi:hypothetical protein
VGSPPSESEPVEEGDEADAIDQLDMCTAGEVARPGAEGAACHDHGSVRSVRGHDAGYLADEADVHLRRR